jgi:hypothetical protein
MEQHDERQRRQNVPQTHLINRGTTQEQPSKQITQYSPKKPRMGDLHISAAGWVCYIETKKQSTSRAKDRGQETEVGHCDASQHNRPKVG